MESGIGWEDAHARVLGVQGIRYEPGYEAYLYHPAVIADQEARQWFSQAARETSARLANTKDE
jgi:hypothetical protein